MTTALPPRSAHKRAAMLSEGQRLFLAQGFVGTSVDQIAAAAGVSKQTVYKHFGDKQELLFAIVDDVVDSTALPFAARVEALAESVDLDSDLTTLATHYLRAVLDERVVQLRRLVVGEANRLPDLATRYHDRAPIKTLAVLAASFDRLHARGILTAPDSARAAEHFAFLVVGSAIDRALFVGGPRTLADIDVDAHVTAAVRVFLAAYRAA